MKTEEKIYRIGEIAEMFDLSKSTIRFYEEIGLFPNLKRSPGGLRLFSQEEINCIEDVECLKKTGMSLKDIAAYVSWKQEGDSSLLARLNLIRNQRLTLEQNILFGADKKKHSKSKLKEKAETLLRLTGLEKFGKAYPDQLSGGMMQRAALARALACDASYLLMDEPFAALDHFTRQTMQKEFLRICAEEKVGALFVTHSVDEALLLGDEILIMENGKVGSWFTIGENLAYPRDLLSEEMIGIKRKIIKTLENRSQTQKNF